MNCPVCDTILNTSVCPKCQFDASRDYEHYPTFGTLTTAPSAVSRLRGERSGLLLCSRCGSADFHFRFADRNLSCPRCGHLLTPREMDTVLAIMGCAPLLHQTPSASAPPPHQKQPDKLRITAVSAGYAHTAVLYSDGTVRAIGHNGEGQCDTGHWRNIVAIAAGSDTTVGLKADGTIVSTKHYNRRDMNCTDVTAIAAGGAGIACVRRNGTVVFPWSGISSRDWYGISKVCSSWHMVLGTKKDGMVAVFSAGDDLPPQVRNWLNITDVCAGFGHVAGLRRNGSVVSAGDNTFSQCDTGTWNGITAICAGDNHTVGLKADGTVIAAGIHGDGRCEVWSWTNVTAISAGGAHTIALRSDGTLLAAGSNREGQCAIFRLIP